MTAQPTGAQVGTGREEPADGLVFCGLGQMGHHLARHILDEAARRGVSMHGYDAVPAQAARAAQEYGLQAVDDLSTVVGPGATLCLSVPDGAVVEQVLVRQLPEGRLDGLTVFDFSSIAPREAKRFSAMLAERGGVYYDAPVTGGVAGAANGTLTTIIGGPVDEAAHVRWVPEAFSNRVVWSGSSGSGALLKTISNMIGNISSIVTMEGIVMARASGIVDDVLLEVLNNGPARSFYSEVRYPKYVVSRTFDAGMRLGLVDKDLGVAIDAAHEAGVAPTMSLLGRELRRAALEEFGSDADTTRLIELVAQRVAGRSWAAVTAADSAASSTTDAGPATTTDRKMSQ